MPGAKRTSTPPLGGSGEVSAVSRCCSATSAPAQLASASGGDPPLLESLPLGAT